MRTTLSSSILLLTLALCTAGSNPALAGDKGHKSSGHSFNGGGSSSNMQNFSRNFSPRISSGGSSNSSSSSNVKKFTPHVQQFNGSNKPQINLNGITNNQNFKKHIGQVQGLGQNGGKPLVKINPGFNQGGNGNGNSKGGISIGIGKGGVGIGIGVGNNHHNNNNNNHHDNHHHVGCYSWWQGHGYCGGYTHGCKTVIVQPIVTPVAVVEPELAALPTLQVGAKLTMQSSAFSPEAGVVMMQIDKLMFAVQVDDWQAGAVSFTVPVLMLTGPVKADLITVDQAGNVLVAQAVMLVAAPEVAQTAAVIAQ